MSFAGPQFSIDLTAVTVGAISSAVNGVFMFLAVRYAGRFVERIEKTVLNGREKRPCKDKDD